jgi:hypothetical protein
MGCLPRKDVNHDRCAAPGGGDDDVPVDDLGDVGGLVAHGVGDVWFGTPLLLMMDTAV